MAELLIDPGIIEAHNRQEADGLAQDYEALSRSLARRGIDCDALLHKVSALEIAVPSWGVGTGGTRFARFPGPGEPADIFTGGAATVDLVGEGRTGVLAVPLGALLNGGQGTEDSVLVRRDGADPQPVPVMLGTRQGDLVEVVSGLDEGETVLVMGGMASLGPVEEKPR